MADGADIHLDPERAARLRAAAEAAGVSLEAYALQALDQALDDDWSEAIAALEDHDRTGVSYAAEDAVAEFRANVEAGLAKRK
ncbi:hypothetical protein ASD38_16150 [Caulobacter sp. Root487D2Y]|uniref:hypothetical protein n=1 Tax=Caulobacter sp. Root487D2Y TaxID=1736547 RepID=UPI0006FC184C|nr:hypothetical protein [Caulobacter sp. Root487D2Y]KQY28225.1 hypothetical protein ASD38_16150 [Caulobacter sp. Root487D2Y]